MTTLTDGPVLLPEKRDTAPEAPFAPEPLAVPDARYTAPELPVLALPDENNIEPVSVAPVPLTTDTAPELAPAPAADDTLTKPPVVVPAPAVMVTPPPFEAVAVVGPANRDSEPPTPELVVPTAMTILPAAAEVATPVDSAIPPTLPPVDAL